MLVIFAFSLQPCTAFFARKNGKTLVGNNEDYWPTDTKVWFIPSEKGRYGRVCVGFGKLVAEGGMNERGLFLDAFTAPYLAATLSRDKPRFRGRLLDKVLAECASLREALVLLDRYKLEMLEHEMWLIADAGGQSAIVEGDRVHRLEGEYQVASNFRPSQPLPGGSPQRRYQMAEQMLRRAPEISIELFAKILDATHQEITQYSYVCDLQSLDFTLFHFHRFDRAITFHLPEELGKGRAVYNVAPLFPRNEEFEKFKSSRWTPQDSFWVKALMAAAALVFAAAFFYWLARFWIESWPLKKKENAEPVPPRKLLLFVGSFSILAAASHLLFFGVPFDVPLFMVYVYGPRAGLHNVSVWGKLVLWLPLAALLFTLILAPLTASIWRKKIGPLAGRLLAAASVLFSIASLLLYWHWRMLRFWG